MQSDEIQITTGENTFQTASFEPNDKTVDYVTSKNLSYTDIISILYGLNAVSEFYDVMSAVTTTPLGVFAVALGKTIEEAIISAMDSNPIDFISSTVVLSNEVNSDAAKLLKDVKIVVAPKFTKNAEEYLEMHDVCYVTIKTPIKDYKKYLSNKVLTTPLGTLIQSPNVSELDKDSFKTLTKTKPTVEQIEDAVFAWKVAKHIKSRAIVIAKNLKTGAIAQGLQSALTEYALDYSCEGSKDAILACDMPITAHDVNVAAQGRIALLILPSAQKDIITLADKYGMIVITTGFSNVLC